MRVRITSGRVRVPGPGRGPSRWRPHRTQLHWFATLRDSDGTILWQDDCRDLGRLLDLARPIAAAFDCVERLGQEFEPWDDIVERAEI